MGCSNLEHSEFGGPAARVDANLIVVRDHGHGVADRDIEHIFDRFYRAPEARSRPGSGLGLAIVAQVALDEGGQVSAHHAPGGGALFRFALPIIAPPHPSGTAR